MITCQTTIFPGRIFTLTDSEYLDYQRQGIVAPGTTSATDQGATTGAEVIADLDEIVAKEDLP